jgi:hypothetical protein
MQVNILRTTEVSKFSQEITQYWFLNLTVQELVTAQADINFGRVKERLGVRGVVAG